MSFLTKISKIFPWVLGVFYFMIGVLGILEGYYSSLIFLFLGTFITPYFRQKLFSKKSVFTTNLKFRNYIYGLGSLSAFMFLGYETEKQNSIENTNPERNKEIELVNFYINNNKAIDEDGINYDLEIKKREIERIPLFESSKVYHMDRYDNELDSSEYVIIGSYEVKYEFDLLSNGNLINTIRFDGVFFEAAEYRRHFTEKDDGEFEKVKFGYCDTSELYFPELDNEDELKAKINRFTGGEGYCLWGKYNDVVYNYAIESVKKSKVI